MNPCEPHAILARAITPSPQSSTRSTVPIMKGLSERVAFEFCTACNWAHYVWQFHREMFHGKKREDLRGTAAYDALARLSVMTKEYGHLQMLKLHDQACAGGSVSLGIDYIVKYGGWPTETRARLEELQRKMSEFVDPAMN